MLHLIVQTEREWKSICDKFHGFSPPKDDLNKFDISIPVGISYEFKVPIVIDLRYNIGLSKIGKSDSAFKDSRSNTCMLTLGYKFKL